VSRAGPRGADNSSDRRTRRHSPASGKGSTHLFTQSLSEAAASRPLLPPSAITADAPATDLRQLVLDVLDDAKAENAVAIDLRGKTSLADHMVIASGRSDRHVGAIAEQIIQRLKDDGHGSARVEGMPLCEWVLIDAGDVIVHVFKPEIRGFYNLEKMWSGDRPDETGRR
jgi:ribosome-associated protein